MTVLDICLLQWNMYNSRMQKVFDTISDENFQKPIISNGNSPSWILGHLVDTEDGLLELFGIGKRIHPELKRIYHHEPGTNQEGHFAKNELIAKWKSISSALDKAFQSWNENDWMSRHTAVSEEDFKKEPHRNRLNVMLSRVAHKASHLGQIAMQSK